MNFFVTSTIRWISFLALTMTCIFSHGQSTVEWDGGGDGTTWEDGVNWVGDTEPAAGDIVSFNNGGTFTVVGTPSNNPGSILVDDGTTVTLDLDLTISNSTGQHGVSFGSTGSNALIFGAGNSPSITISSDVTMNGIRTIANSTLTIHSSASVEITQGIQGIYNYFGTINNDGTLTISGATNEAISLTGPTSAFNNNGTFVLSAVVSRGMRFFSNAVLNNSSDGDITVLNSTDYGIDMNQGIINNDGTITIASASTHGIRLNISEVNNSSTGNFLVTNATTRGIYLFNASAEFNNDGFIDLTSATNGLVVANGDFNNAGTIQTSRNLTIAGGVIMNDAGGRITLAGVRLSISSGEFTNNGIITSTSANLGVDNVGGTAINNAFYSYSGGGNDLFGDGTVTDNGVDVDVEANMTFDLANDDQIDDIGIDVAYAWYDDAIRTTQVATNDASGSFHFEHQDGITGITQVYTVYGSDVVLNSHNVLPVKLTSFTLISSENGVLLNWLTASEINNLGFEIQKSQNGEEWGVIGFIKGNGTVSKLNEYQFEDKRPSAGINYYRLRQIDLDGKSELLPIRIIYLKSGGEAIRVYPNPTSGITKLNTSGAIPRESISLMDAQGQSVDFGLNAGNQLDLSHVSCGVYFIKVAINGINQVIRVVKEE